MLKGTFGLAKNTEQQFEAREVLRGDLVKAPGVGGCKCVSEPPPLPRGCLVPALFDASSSIIAGAESHS